MDRNSQPFSGTTPTLRIDAVAETACLQAGGAKDVFSGRWYEFFLLLATLRCENPDGDARHLEPAELCRFGKWAKKDLDSTGKEVSAKLKKLRGTPLEQFLGSGRRSDRRTHGWRLAISPKSIRWSPSQEIAAQSLRDREWTNDFNPRWLELAVNTTVSINAGRLEDAIAASTEMLDGSTSTITRNIATQFKVRSLIRAGKELDDELEDRVRILGRRAIDPVAKAVYARIRTQTAFQARIHEPRVAYADLSRIFNGIEDAGDLSTQGVMLNMMGLIAQKAGKPQLSERLLVRAIPLLLVVGDYYMLSAALYNLAQAKYAIHRADLTAAALEIYRLLEIEIAIRDQLTVGRDSLQSEILGAATAFRTGDAKMCQWFINRGNELVLEDTNAFDQACFRRVRGKNAWLQGGAAGERRRTTLNELEGAEKLFRKDGHPTTTIKEEIEGVRAGVGPYAKSEWARFGGPQ